MANQSLSRSQSIIQSSYPSSPQAAGMIIAFAGSSAPAGWAICDGSELSIASYGQLYGRIGTTWNNARNQALGSNWANPAGGNFRLPDLRGTFLRSTGTSSGYGATTLGSTQDDATVKNGLDTAASSVTGVTGTLSGSTGAGTSHYHQTAAPVGTNGNTVNSFLVTNTLAGGNVGFTNTSNGTFTNLTDFYNTGSEAAHTHPAGSLAWAQSGTGTAAKQALSSTDTETRPVNVGVNYLIKLYDDAGAIVMSGSPFVGSEFQPAPITISGNNTLDYSKFYTCDSATPTTQTLPAATGGNKVITIENTNTGLLTVDGNASETINGSLNQVIGQYQSLKLRDYAVGKWIVMH